jgi:putative Ig domain-containing protein
VFAGPCRCQRGALAAVYVAAASVIGCSGDAPNPGEPSPENPGEENPPPETPTSLRITTSVLPSATVDLPYQTSLQASGGAPPYRWVVSFDPPGLSTSEQGLISGTPGYPAGTYRLEVSVYDAASKVASADLSLEVAATSGLRITSLELTTGDVNEPYVDTVEVAGGAPPYTFDWVNGIEDLTLNPSTGILSGIPSNPTGPTGEGRQTTVTVSDLVGASAFAIVRVGIRPTPLVITTELPDGRVDEPYRVELDATGGTGGRTWTVVSGELPPGLSLNTSTLYGWTHLEGTPTTVGSYSFTLQVSAGGILATREYTVEIADRLLSIVTSMLPDADVATPYSVFLVRKGGTGPYEWDVISGNLPPGISLSSEGQLSGTPTTTGDFSFEVRVRDTGGQSASALLALQVGP